MKKCVVVNRKVVFILISDSCLQSREFSIETALDTELDLVYKGTSLQLTSTSTVAGTFTDT